MKRSSLLVVALLAAGWVAMSHAEKRKQVAQAETYSLVQAIGNVEHVSAHGMAKYECESRKTDLKLAAAALSGGSVTCIPDELVSR